MKRITMYVALTALLLAAATGCKEKNDVEAEGQICLSDARVALSTGDFAQAKGYIDKLRKEYPLALNAREEGILLLDSIDLAEAHVQLAESERQAGRPNLSALERDTLNINLDRAQQKVKFFMKKLEHDKASLKRH